jgi:hypothetical protein
MTVDLHQLFLGLQQQLSATLSTNRRAIRHPGTKGDASELNWLKMLNTHLPARYRAEKAFVLDAEGQLSEQTDVVVFDRQYCPLLFVQGGAKYVPAESVYAVFEVKQELSKKAIEYAARKAATVRQLRRTSVPIPHAGGVYPPKPHSAVLAGVLALDSSWRPGIGEPLVRAIRQQPVEGRLDLGCVLLHGGVEISYPEDGPPRIDVSEEKTALVFFFIRLLRRLQQLGTVPAMDLGAYGKGL